MAWSLVGGEEAPICVPLNSNPSVTIFESGALGGD